MRSDLGLLLMMCAGLTQAQVPLTPNDWLLGAPDDTSRFGLLQTYLRGFDQPMWEVGERYRRVYEALQRENYDLAIYHWDKIRTTIENGYLKRPARQANADALFLDTAWVTALEAFGTRDRSAALAGFAAAREACMNCHVAEGVTFMNQQPLFEDTAPPEP